VRPVLIDTNAYTAFKKGDEQIITILQHADVIAVSTIVLGELLAGFAGGNRVKKNSEELRLFLQSTRIKIYSVTPDTAYFFGHIFNSLKQKGKPIPTNDIWIAAQALEHGSVICSYDAHFNAIDGLLVASTIDAFSVFE
jgi:tRNA(fMet)-specific endonuclease VapC